MRYGYLKWEQLQVEEESGRDKNTELGNSWKSLRELDKIQIPEEGEKLKLRIREEEN